MPDCSPSSAARTPSWSFERSHDARIGSFAAGKSPRAAAISGRTALVYDGKRWTELRPELPEGVTAEIYFGRDNWPRMLGRIGEGPDARPFYRRAVAGQWREARDELGPLAAPAGALYGVLGHADPEVVCRPEQRCIVKRTSGWSGAAAHAEPVKVVLSGGDAWALSASGIERLDGDRWAPLEPARTWSSPRALFSDGAGTLLVIEADRDEYVSLRGGAWVGVRSPVRGPRDVWGSSAHDIWIVGDGGAAHYDGKDFACLADVPGPLSHVAFDGEALWLAGGSGIWRGTRAVPSR